MNKGELIQQEEHNWYQDGRRRYCFRCGQGERLSASNEWLITILGTSTELCSGWVREGDDWGDRAPSTGEEGGDK